MQLPRALHKLTKTPRGNLLRAKSGMAATEFALIAPIMVLIFFGVIEGSDALSTSRKVSLSVNTLSDLAAQETSILHNQLDDLFVGVEDIIDQRDITVGFTLISVVLDPDTNDVVVHWSRDNNGAAPYAPGSVYAGLPNANLLDNASSLIVAEVEYVHTSSLAQVLFPSFTFNRSATRWPRRSLRVQLCASPSVCTT